VLQGEAGAAGGGDGAPAFAPTTGADIPEVRAHGRASACVVCLIEVLTVYVCVPQAPSSLPTIPVSPPYPSGNLIKSMPCLESGMSRPLP
jgi:hypothetical protein